MQERQPMKQLFSLKSLSDLSDYTEFQNLSKRIFIKVLIILGLPILTVFGIQDLLQSDYFIFGIVFLLILILLFLLFELTRKPATQKPYLSQEIIIRLFLVTCAFFFLYIMGFEKDLNKALWFLIFPVLIFFLTDIKEALIWTFCVVIFLVPLLFYADLNSSPGEVFLFKERIFVIFGILTCVSFITTTIIRIVIQNLIDSKKKISDTNMRLNDEIKARKRAEEALRQSEIRFRSLVESSSDWIWEVNSEGMYIYVSPLVEEILGYKPEEIIGKTPFDLMPPEEAVRLGKIFMDIVEKGEPIIALENVNLHKDGRHIILETSGVPVRDESGKITHYRGIDRNITERKQTEELLKENENKYRTLFESSADAISIIDLNTYKFSDCNSAAVKLHGTGTRENFLGLTPAQLSPEFQPNGKLSHKLSTEYIQEAFKQGGKMFEWTHCKADGTHFPVIVTLTPMILGEIKLVIAIAKDITHRKQAEEAREKLLKNLQEAFESVKTLSGLVPICAKCKKIRDDKGYWNQIEVYIQNHSRAKFSHGICPECSDKLYGNEDWYIKKEEDEEKK